MYLRKIHLENIRDFEDFTLDMTDDKGAARLWTVLIGANGTGKTTLLRAIAIGLANESDANSMLASPIGDLVGRGKDRGTIKVSIAADDDRAHPVTLCTIVRSSGQRETISRSIEFDLGPEGDNLDYVTNFEPFLVGYGVSRTRSGKDLLRNPRIFDNTRTLFDYDAELTPAELTLRRIQDFLGQEPYDRAMAGIGRALNLPPDTKVSVGEGGGLTVRGGPIPEEMPLDGWADGYRLSLGWMLDLYGCALHSDSLTEDGGIRGILLLDEVEQHTHPSVQLNLVPRLKKLWPELQVVATTHSPLVVLNAEANETVGLVRRDQCIAVAPQSTSFEGYSMEDILEDERLFNTTAERPETIDSQSDFKRAASIPPEERSAEDRRLLSEAAVSLRRQPTSPASKGSLLEDLQALRDKYNL